jgi:ParB-like chromosome segregation protein Spo0J
MTDPLEFHPLADLFPLMEGEEFDSFVASIKQDGQNEPIVLFDGKILDGRNRYRACTALGAEPVTVEFEELVSAGKIKINNPVRYVMSMNIHRRHLNASQRALIAAEIANLSVGNPHRTESGQFAPIVGAATIGVSQADTAKILNVHRTTVVDAKMLLEKGTPEQIQAVRSGKAAVSTFANQARANRTDAEKAKRQTTNKEAHAERMQMESQLYTATRDALNALSGLPHPAEVVRIIRQKRQLEKVIEGKLPQALKWLQEFANAWDGHNG